MKPAANTKIFPTTSLVDPRPLPFLPVLVRDVMTAQPVTVEPSSTVKEIAHQMLSRDIRALPVVDVADVLVGMVGEADVISRAGYPAVRNRHLAGLLHDAIEERRHHWAARGGGLTAGEIMTVDVISCRPDEPVSAVARRMLQGDVRTLPVTDGQGRLVGVVSRHDLLHLYDRPDTEIRDRIREMLDDPLWAPEDHHVDYSVRDGVVVLTGTVVRPSDREVVASIVRQVPGVLEVVNHLSATGSEPRPALMKDTDWR